MLKFPTGTGCSNYKLTHRTSISDKYDAEQNADQEKCQDPVVLKMSGESSESIRSQWY